MKIAAITMVYNEGRALQRWIEYYSKQDGAQNCFVIDHGSDDESTVSLEDVKVLKIPRSPQDDIRRTNSISHFTNYLLCWYDYVIYVDCDEFLVADPRKYNGLYDYCGTVRPEYMTSIGINIIHVASQEPGLTPGRPILSQRSYGMFVSAMSKPNITSTPVLWSPGFHHRDRPAVFGDLFLFHLRYADVGEGLARLQTTRKMAWQSEKDGAHQRVLDEDWRRRVNSWASLPVVEDDPWSSKSGILCEYANTIANNQFFAPHRGIYYVKDELRSGVYGKELLRIPEAFRDSF